MGVTLDTNVLIDLLAGDKAAVACLREIEDEGAVPVLTSVAVFEALAGIEFTKSRSARAELEGVLRRYPIEPFGLEGARWAAELRAELRRTGRTPSIADVMIAGHAQAQGHVLVSRDRRLLESARALGIRAKTY